MDRLITAAALMALAACATTTTRPGNPNAAPHSAASSENDRWVCHGSRNPKWKKVALSAVDAHRRHGDRIVSTPHTVGTACTQ